MNPFNSHLRQLKARKTHQAPRNDARDRHRDHPGREDPRNAPPVHRLHVAVADAHSRSRADDALRRGDRERELRREHDGDRGAELHAEAARGRVQGEAVAEDAHDLGEASESQG